MLLHQSQPENLNLLATEAQTLVRWFQFLEKKQRGGCQRRNGAFLDPNILEHSVEFLGVISAVKGVICYPPWENGLDIIAFLTLMQKMKMASSIDFARLIMEINADEKRRGAEVKPLPATYYSQKREYITCEQAINALIVFNILDQNNSAAIDFKSFLGAVEASRIFGDLDETKCVFLTFDADGDGNLDVVEAMELLKMLNKNRKREDLQLAAVAIQLKALQQVRATATDRSSGRNGEAHVLVDPEFMSFEDIWPVLQDQLHFPERKSYAKKIFLSVTNRKPRANAQQIRQFMQHNDIRRHLNNNNNKSLQRLQERAKSRADLFDKAARTSPSPAPSPTNDHESSESRRESRFRKGQNVAKKAFGAGVWSGEVEKALEDKIAKGFIHRMEDNLGQGSPGCTMSELAQLDLGQTVGAALKEALIDFAAAVAENITAELGLQMVAEVLALLTLDCVVPGLGILIGFAFNVGLGGRIRRFIFPSRPGRK
ncbi:hypothetical protein ACA910_003536 [Epithemia clementina (nom. ined.)]